MTLTGVEDPYSFRLDSAGNSPRSPAQSSSSSSTSGRSTTANSTLCKEKIDRIFAQKRRETSSSTGDDGLPPNGIPSAFSNREEQAKFKQHLQSQIQRIVNERRNHLEKELVTGTLVGKKPRTRAASELPNNVNVDEQIDRLFSDACDAHYDSGTMTKISVSETGSVSLSISPASFNNEPCSFESLVQNKILAAGKTSYPPPEDNSDTSFGTENDEVINNELGGMLYQMQHHTSRTRVEYLGCLPLSEKATHLEVLQLPLKKLYLQHLGLRARGQSPLRGTLEITGSGLKLQYYR